MSTGPASAAAPAPTAAEIAALADALHIDGITGLAGAFAPGWADELHEDFAAAFGEARRHPRGTADRGLNRFYLAVHPEQVRGFVDLVTHPILSALCAHVLGSDYQVVELGFDVPLPGAEDQPWHRDFPGDATQARRLGSLAFNITTVDVTSDMGPFQVAPGTHWDDGADWPHGMFPTDSARYVALAQTRCPRRGDVAVRTGLTVHRGTANTSGQPRAVLILGVTTRQTDTTGVHNLHVTPGYHDALPAVVRARLRCTVVATLRPIEQRHDIEGLMMGAATGKSTRRSSVPGQRRGLEARP